MSDKDGNSRKRQCEWYKGDPKSRNGRTVENHGGDFPPFHVLGFGVIFCHISAVTLFRLLGLLEGTMNGHCATKHQ